MGDNSSKTYIYIDSRTAGNKQLTKVKSIDTDDEGDLTVTTSVGVDEGSGFQEKPGGYELTLEVYREDSKPEVDWQRLKRLKEKFAITLQDEGDGQREQYQNVRVAKISRKGDDQGSNMITVKLKAQKYKPLKS